MVPFQSERGIGLGVPGHVDLGATPMRWS
jgi:hypothetical protein